jgi:uncharacterized protein YqgC (DUF456 family)
VPFWSAFLHNLGAAAYVVALVVGVLAAFLGLPGNPWVLLCGFGYSALNGWKHPSLTVLLVLLPVVLLAELADGILGMLGVRRYGGSSKTMWYAALGSLAGALALSWLAGLTGLIGLVFGPAGSVLGAIIPTVGGGLLGGYLGGYWYELRQGRDPETARRAGWGALVGRLAGGLAKGGFALVITIVLLIYSF